MVDVIIVNYNQINNCLNLFSLLENEESVNMIYCVDNSDELSNYFLTNVNEFSKLKVINPSSNIGFGKANNLGISYSTKSRILICNPDIFFEPNTINKIDKLYDNLASKDLGYCFHMIDSNGFTQNSHSRLLNRNIFLVNLLGLSFLLPKNLRVNYKNLKNEDKVDQPIGAFLFLKKEHFLSVGGFDQDFFVYFEDLYLFYNLNKKYNKMKYTNQFRIYHKGGESSKSSISKMLSLQISGRKIYFEKRKWTKMNKGYLIFEYFLKVIYYRKNIKINNLFNLYKSYTK